MRKSRAGLSFSKALVLVSERHLFRRLFYMLSLDAVRVPGLTFSFTLPPAFLAGIFLVNIFHVGANSALLRLIFCLRLQNKPSVRFPA